jgi:hypothetical protein
VKKIKRLYYLILYKVTGDYYYYTLGRYCKICKEMLGEWESSVCDNCVIDGEM